MPRFSKHHVPTYRLHKASGQAIVRIAGSIRYLGAYDTPASRQVYNQLIATWFQVDCNAAAMAVNVETPPATGPTVEDVLAGFWAHAQTHYRDKDLKPTKEQTSFFYLLKLLRQLYSSLEAGKFGPLCLEKCQAEMIRTGLSRKSIIRQAVIITLNGLPAAVRRWVIARICGL